MQSSKIMDFLLRRRPAKEDSPYAGYSDRMLSAAIDLFLIMVLLRRPFAMIDAAISPYLHRALAESLLRETMANLANKGVLPQVSAFLNTVFSSDIWVYVVLNHGLAVILVVAAMTATQCYFKTTPGKWVMGLKLVGKDLETPPSCTRILLRYVVCVLSCGVLMMGFLWVMFNKKHRAWHDVAANTYVLNLRPKGWYWQQVKRGFFWVKDKFTKGS